MLRALLGVRSRLLSLTTLVIAFVSCVASTASAQQPPSPFISDIEVSLGIGLVDRGTTGIGAPLLGYGYDHAAGVGLELDVRMFTPGWHRAVHQGLALRAFHQSGRAMGIGDDDAFQVTGLDLAYVFRALLPCMSSDEISFHLTPLLGLSALRARAGNRQLRGDQTGDLDDAARASFDHMALGGVLGVQFDMHHGALLIALSADIREHVAVGDTPVARDFMTSLTLRVGVDIDL